MPKPTGTNPAHLLKKLRQAGRSDLVREVEDGRLTAWEAAVEGGIRHRLRDPDASSNAAKRKLFRRYPHRASKDQEMQLGVGHYGSAFATEAEARAYWFENRERLWPLLCVGGTRPQAWWYWEAKLRYPGIDAEAAVLYELGQLGLVEASELMPGWRQKYDHACTLRGLTAIRDYLDEAVLPLTLFERWNAERRRAARTIRELQAEVGKAEPTERTGGPR